MSVSSQAALILAICALLFIALRHYHNRQLRSIATLLRARSREFDAAAKHNGVATNKAFLLDKADAYSYAYLAVTCWPGNSRAPKDAPMILTVDETTNTIVRTAYSPDEERSEG